MASQYQMIMRSGPTPGAAFALEGDQITIGRDSSNDIVINDAEVSRRHARLTFQGGKYVLEDLGSTNGTFVNGQRLAGPRVLKPGEVVSFGEQIVLVFEAVNVDPGATMVSPRAAAVPPVSRPVSSPPPPPANYAGNVPASPAAAPAEAKRTNLIPILIGAGVLAFLCLCVVVFLIVDADPTGARWCMFPFRIIAEMLRGPVCP
ncbi:MAG TPA: FHA domain-containing protein [Anaerolineales bacterium]|nr:FHA domain-containing protein [Anaerolineales bacterium]